MADKTIDMGYENSLDRALEMEKSLEKSLEDTKKRVEDTKKRVKKLALMHTLHAPVFEKLKDLIPTSPELYDKLGEEITAYGGDEYHTAYIKLSYLNRLIDNQGMDGKDVEEFLDVLDTKAKKYVDMLEEFYISKLGNFVKALYPIVG